MLASGESCVSWVAGAGCPLGAAPQGSVGQPLHPPVPAGPLMVLPATALTPATCCAAVGKREPGPGAPRWGCWGLRAGWPRGEDGDEDEAGQGLHAALATDLHDLGLAA